MESAHVIVLERLAAAVDRMEVLATAVSHASGTTSADPTQLPTDEVCDEQQASPSSLSRAPPPLASVRDFMGRAEDVLRASLGSDEALWRRVCRLEEKLQRLSHVAAPGSGVYSVWRSTAALDCVEPDDEDEDLLAYDSVGDADNTMNAGRSAVEDDPFAWVTGGTPHTEVADVVGAVFPRRAAVETDPARLLKREQGDQAYAKATAHELFELFRARQRLGSAVDEVENRLVLLVHELDALFAAHDSGELGAGGSPLARAQAWLRWEPTYTVTNPAEQQHVWDRFATEKAGDGAVKDWRDLRQLCHTNRRRFAELCTRLQHVQRECVALLQLHNEKMAHATLALDELEAHGK